MSIETLHRLREASSASPLFAELSLVVLVRAIETDDEIVVPAGTRGTVVAVYGGGAAYEIEFVHPVVGNATVPVDGLRAI